MFKSLKQAAFVASTAVLVPSAFAQTSPVEDVTSAITTNMADATTIVVAAGLALVTLGFLGFILRKAKGASEGRIR